MKSPRGQHSTQDHLSERETPNDNVQTPLWLIDRMVLWLDSPFDGTICDPSCGIDNRMVQKIWNMGYMYRQYYYGDPRYKGQCHFNNFLEWRPDFKIDRFIMNPPFSNLGALKFIKHALKMLSENGRIIAVVPNYILDNADGRKPWLAAHIWRMAMIPKNTFAEYGCFVLHGSVIDIRHTGSGYFDYFEPDKGPGLFVGNTK